MYVRSSVEWRSLAGELSRLAMDVHGLLHGLGGATSVDVWRGPAAAIFREEHAARRRTTWELAGELQQAARRAVAEADAAAAREAREALEHAGA